MDKICGIINVLKPPFMTSSDAVSKVRGIFSEKRVGHLGTLDPFASGVLPIAIGKATRLFDLYLDKQKKYRAFFDFACETDTLDSDGKITNFSDKTVSDEEVVRIMAEMTGKQLQIPPQYSSKSVDGRRAYSYARADKQIELKPCEIEIFSIKLVDKYKENGYVFDITCSSGTYIRAIARDMAKKLGVFGFMSALIRLQAGMFEIENALRFDEIEHLKKSAVVSAEEACGFLDKIVIENESEMKRLYNGIKADTEKADGRYALYGASGFVGVAAARENKLSIEINFTV